MPAPPPSHDPAAPPPAAAPPHTGPPRTGPPPSGAPPLLRPGLPVAAAVAIACTASFMVVTDGAIVNVALPAMSADLGLASAAARWVVDAYLLVLGGCTLLAARAGDLFGRRATLQAGLLLFTAAGALGGLAGSGQVLIAARAAQGLGASALATSTLGVVLAATADRPELRRRAMSAWAASSSSAAALGVLLGGVLTEHAGWRWVMYVNVPVGIALLTAVQLCLRPTDVRGSLGRLDLPGAFVSTTGVGLLLFGVTRGSESGWTSPTTLVSLAAAALLLTAFVRIEARSANPLVRLPVFRLPGVPAGNLVVLLLGSSLTASLFLVSQLLQQVLGYSAQQAGLAMLPMGGCLAAAALVSRRLLDAGARRLPLYGGTVAAAGLLWLATLPADAGFAADLLGPLLLIGTGLGLMLMSATTAATAAVPPAEAGLASGLLNTSRQLGGALGLALLGALAQSVTGTASGAAALLHGSRAALVAAAALSLLGALTSLLLPGARSAGGTVGAGTSSTTGTGTDAGTATHQRC
ncbi:MFS transporter [Kitasatospora sp. NPDC086791]|uniref:MFS transporter n=1 Tax=Kitasatospora sp. NPDC086791 TaxID=3155178 RepID=UPI00342011E0